MFNFHAEPRRDNTLRGSSPAICRGIFSFSVRLRRVGLMPFFSNVDPRVDK
jgi:hypothetical protein